MHNGALNDLSFASLRLQDLPLLAAWLARPHVAEWWRETSDLDDVVRRYGPLTGGSDPTEAFIVTLEDRQIGYVQSYRIDDDPDWNATLHSACADAGGIGIDYLIGELDLVGKGIGRRMIAEFVGVCWNRYPSASRITVALQQANVASWKALEGAGFRRLWSGTLESSDPSDQGPSFLYARDRDPE